MTPRRERGALAIVLHTHMPYVEGFGTWPFGEEWLWEAIASSYLPLLELLDAGAPLTLSLTPVLCDQLEVPDLAERFGAFVRDVRRATHEQDAAGLRAAEVHWACACRSTPAWRRFGAASRASGAAASGCPSARTRRGWTTRSAAPARARCASS